MRSLLALAMALGATLLAGCHRGETLGCEDTRRYASAASVPPVQIPDDLSPPSETDALRLPPEVPTNRRPPTQPCLESPPAFSEQIQLGRSADVAPAAAAPKPSRRERRQQRRHGDESK
jgi:uncharacterized lipoprotein